jgi:hypothetical protein
MKRRQAIRRLAWLSSGVVLLPGCNFEAKKAYDNLGFSESQFELIRQVQQAIFPLEKLPTHLYETAYDFLLMILNDCALYDELVLYIGGMHEFQQYIGSRYQMPFAQLTPAQQFDAVDFAFYTEEPSECLQFFIQANKDITLRHIIQSEYYQKEHLDFEFVPARFHGSVEI